MNTINQAFKPSDLFAIQPAVQERNELGQDDFFRLMVAQLNNQDPTNPMDNAEFLGQLAQFSTVTGIDELGDSFQGLVSNMFASQAMMAAQLIERQVLVDAGTVWDAFYQTEEPLSGSFETDDVTTNSRVTIYDGAGNLVNTIDMGTVEPGTHQFTWNGIRKDGSEASNGRYLIVAEGYVGGDLVKLPLQRYSTVTSVSVDRANSSVLLHLDTGSSVRFSQVSEFK